MRWPRRWPFDVNILAYTKLSIFSLIAVARPSQNAAITWPVWLELGRAVSPEPAVAIFQFGNDVAASAKNWDALLLLICNGAPATPIEVPMFACTTRSPNAAV